MNHERHVPQNLPSGSVATPEVQEANWQNRDTAWLMGFLGWKGNIRSSNALYRLGLKDEQKRELVDKILAENFDIQMRQNPYSGGKGTDSTLISIENSQLHKIGDLTAEHCTQTLQSRYGWIFENQDFTYEFLSGAIDSRSHLGITSAWKNIIFFLPNSFSASFFGNVLSELGYHPSITKPRQHHNTHNVGVFKSEEVKKLAQNLHPRTSDKQQKIQILSESESYSPADILDVIKDRENLRRLLGRRPSYNDIYEARKSRKASYGKDVYARVFGDGKVAVATKTLGIFDMWTAEVHRRFDFDYFPDEILVILLNSAKQYARSVIEKNSNTDEDPPELPEELINYVSNMSPDQKKRLKKCVHYWSYDPFHGGRTIAKCRNCGLEKILQSD